MNTRHERRSKEAPMDFEWTNNRDVITLNSPFRPAKRSHTDMTATIPNFPQGGPSTPTFGANRDVPFMFSQPRPNVAPTHPWTPPASKTISAPEINDVAMRDASPPKSDEADGNPNVRAVATGAMRRVFRARQKQGMASRDAVNRRRKIEYRDEDDDAESDEGGLSETGQSGEMSTTQKKRTPRRLHSEPVTTTANHNHHYTLHMQAPRLSHSEIPYLLLGYLQFFFNLCLVFGFLYLAYLFLRAVQKDVEQKMTEHTLDSLQEIRACAHQYDENFCAGRPSPIIAQQCHEWKACMERDASIVGRTRLFAELVGEVINGFMEPISWRTLIFTITSLSVGIALVNVLLTFYRGRHTPANVPLASETRPAPSFPMYSVGSPHWAHQPPSTPLLFQSPYPGGEMRRPWSTAVLEEEEMETPSRRRRINQEDVVAVK